MVLAVLIECMTQLDTVQCDALDHRYRVLYDLSCVIQHSVRRSLAMQFDLEFMLRGVILEGMEKLLWLLLQIQRSHLLSIKPDVKAQARTSGASSQRYGRRLHVNN
jgi:hypothetical protein